MTDPIRKEIPAKSHFTFPARIEETHKEELKRRAISPEFAVQSGVRTIADNEARALSFHASLPADELKNGLNGICFPYRDLALNNEVLYRIKPDRVFTMGDGRKAKYLSRKGDPVRPFYPHTTTAEMMANPKVNVVITEGEYKALSIAENICSIASRPTAAIGLMGINGGWGRDKLTVTKPDGTKEIKRVGHAHLIPDLSQWAWSKRTVYLYMDSDVATKEHATEFKKSSRSGVWGAEFTLAQLLRAQGADVRIVQIPPRNDGLKYGVDDYIAARGGHAALRLMYNNWVPERSVDEVLYKSPPSSIRIESAASLVERAPATPTWAVHGLLPTGCVGMISGGTGVGKSLLSMALCHAVATGGRFLGQFQCSQGKTIYIQTELPEWMVAQRIKAMGPLPEDFMVCTPGTLFPMNFWEPDGFNKRRETGFEQIVNALTEKLKGASPRLVVFDPLKDFTTLSLTDPTSTSHLMNIFSRIAEYCQCGVIISHHSRKIGGRMGTYEGSDDSYGAYNIAASMTCQISIYTQTAIDGTMRYKIVFSKVRCGPPIAPMELERLSGADASSWSAVEWQSHTSVGIKPDQKILEILHDGPNTYQQVCDHAKMSKTTFYRSFSSLEKRGLVKKKGNLYYISEDDDAPF